MIRVADIATKQLLNSSRFGFAGLSFGKKRKPTPSDLSKYDVVVVGGNLGAIFSTHLDAVVKQKAKIFVSYDNPNTHFYVQRGLYEQGRTTKFDMSTSTKGSISKNNGHSENVGVEKIIPEKNEVVLRNGRTIGYDYLVLATGQKENFESIKGFQEAWSDPDHAFHTNADHPSWKGSVSKPFRYHYNFNGGEAIYYIPPSPFTGEIENYNFLLSKFLWNWYHDNGKISWDSSRLTIINGNNSFCSHFKKVDDFIRLEAQKRNIQIQDGLTLVEVKKDRNTAIFQNQRTGEYVEKLYQNFFSLMPVKPHTHIAEAGLADSHGYLDVNQNTLQHKKYDNIFGLGDCHNAPTTKTFYGGLSQVSVLRHNLQRRMNGLSMNVNYDGYAEAPLFLTPNNLSWVSHLYNGVEASFDTSSIGTALKYKKYTMFDKKDLANLYHFKNWGPPYYKFKKSFGDTGSSAKSVSKSGDLHPQKKTV